MARDRGPVYEMRGGDWGWSRMAGAGRRNVGDEVDDGWGGMMYGSGTGTEGVDITGCTLSVDGRRLWVLPTIEMRTFWLTLIQVRRDRPRHLGVPGGYYGEESVSVDYATLKCGGGVKKSVELCFSTHVLEFFLFWYRLSPFFKLVYIFRIGPVMLLLRLI